MADFFLWSRQGVVCWDTQPPQLLESFVWVQQRLSMQGTVTLLMTLLSENSRQNTPVFSGNWETKGLSVEATYGYAVFSKLDLRWGFHQIELDAESRDITAFATHDGIFRYKRLSFGVNAAPEKYQHIITQSMAGLQGVANIADNLIVHGRDTEEHDKNLHNVLERLSEKK